MDKAVVAAFRAATAQPDYLTPPGGYMYLLPPLTRTFRPIA